MSKIRSALKLTALESYVSVALQLANTMVISRLLTPADIGAFAVAAVFATLAGSVRDFGVGEFLIQDKSPTTETFRAAIGVNILVSWLMAALMLAGAPAVAAFYATPVIADVMRVQAVSFLLIPFGAITMAWFRREMKFGPFVAVRLSGNVAGFVATVGLAMAGTGVMSMAWGALVNVAVTVIASVAMRPPHLPSRPSLRGAARVLRFGSHVSGVYILAQLGKGAPEMIIGRAQDMVAVGLFSRGQGLVEIFNMLVLRAVTPVCLPYFAAEVRISNTPRSAQLRAMALITGLGWPFLAGIALLADSAIRLIYGPQWDSAVQIARILCAVAMIEIVYFTSKEALLSLGLAADANRLQASVQALRVIGLCSAFAFGLTGAALGLLGAAVAGALLSARTMKTHVHLSYGETARTLRGSALLALGPVCLMAGLLRFAQGHVPDGTASAAAAATGVLAWLTLATFIRHPTGDWVLGTLRRLSRKRPP